MPQEVFRYMWWISFSVWVWGMKKIFFGSVFRERILIVLAAGGTAPLWWLSVPHYGLVSWTTASPPVLLIIQERQDQNLPSTEIQLSYTLGLFYSNRCVQITWINSITDTTTTIPPLPPPSRSLVNPPISLITNVPRINHSRPCVGIQGTNSRRFFSSSSP